MEQKYFGRHYTCASVNNCVGGALASFAAAALYLCFANAYDFFRAAAAKKSVRHTGRTGSIFTYLSRYLLLHGR